MLVLLLLLCAYDALASVNNKPFFDLKEAGLYFKEFTKKYNKNYVDENERQLRFEIFKETLTIINEKNFKDKHAVYGITNYADLRPEEIFPKGLRSRRKSKKSTECVKMNDTHFPLKDRSIDEAFDWRDENVVTRPKNQFGDLCGSCWAFSTIANVESQYAIKHKRMVDLSEQQLVDCDEENVGCRGGFMVQALGWIKDVGGVMSEEDYPYRAVDGKCKFDRNKVKVKISGCEVYGRHSLTEDQLKVVLREKGPLILGMDFGPLIHYTHGISTNCTLTVIRHGVLLVGYGKDKESGIPYWIIKNSLGSEWGEDGFFRVMMGVNSCGIMSADISTAVM